VNADDCPTCGGSRKDLADRSKPCLPCGGTGSARACAAYYCESTYEMKAILTDFHMLATRWEEEVASRVERPLTASAEMMKHCAAEVRRLLSRIEVLP
jgi:hypothetical protein